MTQGNAHGAIPRAAEVGVFCGVLALVVVFEGLFAGRFLGSQRTHIGHDYAYLLPQLLNGCYWRAQSGLLAVPWFTPALGGGVPFYANPSCVYVSVPQALAFGLGPLAAVRATMIIFAALGFAGMYTLLRRTFHASVWASLFGAVAFALNGFFLARMFIGHAAYHSFLLIPFLAHWILRPLPVARAERRWATARDAVLAGTGFAYVFQSGNFYGVLPALLAIAGLAAIRALLGGGWRGSFARLVLAGSLALCLSAAKLCAGLAMMRNFPRNDYPLPGADSLWNAFLFALRGVFFDAPVDLARTSLVHSRFGLARHELEYGVTWIPLVLLAAWSAIAIFRLTRGKVRRPSRARVLDLAILVAVLALPIALNTYQERWTAMLEHVPILGSSSTLVRCFQAYIPLVAGASALAIDRALPLVARAPVAITALLLLAAFQALHDWSYYARQRYDPRPVAHAFRSIGDGVPPVTEIRVPLDSNGKPYPALDRNDALCTGGSQMLPYEPIFGYGLENFPFGSLRSGPVWTEVDGRWNVKNPVLFLFPAENGGAPGDSFRLDERAQAEALLAYRPFPFQKPFVQRAAEILNLAALMATAAVLASWVVHARARRRDPGASSPAR